MNFHHVTLLVTLHVLYSKAQFGPMPYPQAMSMGMPGMPMQMPIVGPPGMPSVVMPFHSRTADNFRRKNKVTKPRKRRTRFKDSDSSEDSDSDDSSSSSGEARRAGEKYKRRRQVLTPVISYVTKDGYVVYQKAIKKERAKDWLDLGKNVGSNDEEDLDDLPREISPRKKRPPKRKRHSD